MDAMSKQKYVEDLLKGWETKHVSRTNTEHFTGGAISSRTVANIESLDPANAVPGRFMVGRRVMYPARAYAEWIADHFLKQPSK